MPDLVDDFANMRERAATSLKTHHGTRVVAKIDGQPIANGSGQVLAYKREGHALGAVKQMVHSWLCVTYPGVPYYERKNCVDMIVGELLQSGRLVLEEV